jgi:hypothetical protein
LNTAYERSGKDIGGFSTLKGRKDVVFGHLAKIVALTLDRCSEASPLFVELCARHRGEAYRRRPPAWMSRASLFLYDGERVPRC